MTSTIKRVLEILATVKPLAAEYYRLTAVLDEARLHHDAIDAGVIAALGAIESTWLYIALKQSDLR